MKRNFKTAMPIIKNLLREYLWRVEQKVSQRAGSKAFAIKSGYRHRRRVAFYDDTPNRDQYQREVYLAARDYARRSGALTIADVGCGSGFKLVQFLSEFDVVGYDMPATVSFLRSTYPAFKWEIANFEVEPQLKRDVVICADVIEHVPNPDALLRYLKKLTKQRLFISTPDRVLVYGKDHDGPPRNRSHYREWNQAEFEHYVSQYFHIESHVISNLSQATQLIECSPR